MASEQYERLRKVLKPGLAVAEDPPALVREKMHAIHPTQWPKDVEEERVEIAGVPCAWVRTPEVGDSDRVVLFVHGGAFVSTRLEHYIGYAATQSRYTCARFLIPEYSLAPEVRFPSQLEQIVTVYRAVLEQGIAPERIAFMGDSCGGGMALAALCKLRDDGQPLPAAYAGLTPWFDAFQEGDSAVNPCGVDPFVNARWVRARFRDYVGEDGDLSDPLVSPLRAELTGLPPMYLAAGQIDTTRDDSTRLGASAARAGVDVIVDVVGEMIHGFHGLATLFPEADAGCERVGAFVQRCIPDA